MFLHGNYRKIVGNIKISTLYTLAFPGVDLITLMDPFLAKCQ